MGVPKFYRWLSERYPQINQMISGSNILPEFDNFYLDMNGIIHACTHPNDNQTANSLTMREMILAIFRYIDRMVSEIVKPRKILFMAIDGVAPRAKLNQQRARRFRAAQDREESIAKALQRGETVDEEAMFDSNCITPGTEFMEVVGKHLRWFIRKKVKEDPLWRNLRIVFSGHDVPGEGEHKIMQFIRDLRVDPNYEPNQRHCMYGQDADLIMLGLVSHEPHFALLREVVDFSGGRGAGGGKQTVIRQTKDAQFQLLHLSILREYLTLDFALDCTWNPDQERLIDDFIFLTFLVGNDFLPHLPTLDIGEHAFDLLISSYRQLMHASAGYIVCNGEIGDLARLEQLFARIGQQENQILRDREEEVKKSNNKRRKYKDAVVETEEEMEEAEDALQRAYEAAIQEALGGPRGRSSDCSSPQTDGSEGEWIDVSRGKGRNDDDVEEDDDDEEEGDNLVVTKDYRGRYYYEKFKVVPTTDDGKALLNDVMAQYLKGLVWVLAYYVKGCISWTWYYPYHYGPMLQDMTQLEEMTTKFEFKLGHPFRPFQQLLGCLPPASAKLLPRLYQWLMVSNDSPVKHFYPLEFGIDQDGKKNPWEAVVLLDFIDEVRLLEAEALHCPAVKLSQAERNRNMFGNVLTCVFEPSCIETYNSCNPEFGLPDIHCCSSAVSESTPSLAPGAYFKPELIPGTTYPIAGFPSLTILPLKGCKVEAVKVNMFGSESKYKSVLIELQCPQIDTLDSSNAQMLLGRVVYVNYPQVHEARVVAISTEYEEYRMERIPGLNGTTETVSVTRKVFDEIASQRWKKESHEEETKYLKGRGTPGSGGLVVGDIKIRLRVAPLQGLRRDPVTGASKKVYATTSEADVPIQLALWAPPVHDSRFDECEEMSVERLMPFGSSVIALTGKLLGHKGRVVGPHSASDNKASLKQEPKRLKRVVDVEFSLPQPEPPFGYSIAASVTEEFFSSKDLCASLQVSPSVLGKLVGSIKVDVNRADIGLSLKRNGQYQLLGYAHRIEIGDGNSHAQQRKVWTGSDTIQIVGTVGNSADLDAAAEADGCYWEYSVRAATLIFDYKMRFPKLFASLERLPHQSVYNADELLGGDGKKKVEEITTWLSAQPYFKMPRTPFSTSSLSRDAMAAVERAADVYTSLNVTKGVSTVVVKGIALDSVFCDANRSPTDMALPYNELEPRLGDRVVNLTTIGVPFGLRGTVVTIHASTKYVEAIFDEEFIGGKGLQGNCSQFRGHLCPWSGLLLVSRPEEYKEYRKKHGKAGVNVASSSKTKGGPAISSTSARTNTPASVMAMSGVKIAVPPPKPSVETAVVSGTEGEPIKHSQSKSASLLNSLKVGLNKSNVVADNTPLSAASAPASSAANKSSKLLKVLRDRDSTTTTNNLVALLKQQLEISDEEGQISLDAQTAEVKLSNGTGRMTLMEAAGFAQNDDLAKRLLPAADSSILEHNPLMGVISYQAQSIPDPKLSGAIQSSDVNVPSHSVNTNGVQENAKRIAINKEASQRVVKHQLSSNATVSKVSAHTASAHIVKGDDKASASSVAPKKSTNHSTSTVVATSTERHTAGDDLVKVAKEATMPALIKIQQATAASSAATSAATSDKAKPSSIAAILANAKKVLASKQHAAAVENKGGNAVVTAPSSTEKIAKSTSTNHHATGESSSITQILSAAKKHSELVHTQGEATAAPVFGQSSSTSSTSTTRSISDILTHAAADAAKKSSGSNNNTGASATAGVIADAPTSRPAAGTASIASILNNAKRVPVPAPAGSAVTAGGNQGKNSGANISHILSNAKKIPAAAVTATADSHHHGSNQQHVDKDIKPVENSSANVAAAVSSEVRAPTAASVQIAKKKPNSLVPTKVLLSKTATSAAKTV